MVAPRRHSNLGMRCCPVVRRRSSGGRTWSSGDGGDGGGERRLNWVKMKEYDGGLSEGCCGG